jgi:putative tryptophan/tyrosine transport system substrate-binding protein
MEKPMRRREFLELLTGAAVLRPVNAEAQQSAKVYRMAMIHPSHPVADMMETSSLNYYRAFFEELRRLGYVERQNIMIERYSGGGHVENYAELARSVVARNPDLLFAATLWIVGPLKEATSTIPIVALTSDPVVAGLIPSLARPGGNLTGVSVDPGLEIWGKRFQLFREVVPTISRIGILAQHQNPERTALLQTIEQTGIPIVDATLPDRASEDDYQSFFITLSQAGADALFVDGSPEHITKRHLIVELANKFRLPAIYPFRSFVEAGGLMAYGVDLAELFRQAARSIDKVLKGANPGDIPFYQPTKFELVINLAASKALGLVMPPTVLALADELIE